MTLNAALWCAGHVHFAPVVLQRAQEEQRVEGPQLRLQPRPQLALSVAEVMAVSASRSICFDMARRKHYSSGTGTGCCRGLRYHPRAARLWSRNKLFADDDYNDVQAESRQN